MINDNNVSGKAFVKSAVFVGVALASLQLHADTRYQVKEIGVLDGVDRNQSTPTAINNQNTVVGYSGLNKTKAFLYDQTGTLVDIDAIWQNELNVGPNYVGSSITDINENGDIVGYISEESESDSSTKHTAVVQIDGKVQKIFESVSCLTESITDNGKVLLDCRGGPFIYENGNVVALESKIPGSWVVPFAMNNDGNAIGLEIRETQVPFLYENGSATYLDDLTGWSDSGIPDKIKNVYDINNQGQMLISTEAEFGNNYIIDANGSVLRKIDSLVPETRMIPYALNENLQVVGESNGKPILNTDENGTVDLNSITDTKGLYRLNYAADINERGVIVGRMSSTSSDINPAFISFPEEAVEENENIKPGGFKAWVTDEKYNSVEGFPFVFDVPDGSSKLKITFKKFKGNPDISLLNEQTGEIHECVDKKAKRNSKGGGKCVIQVDQPMNELSWHVSMPSREDFSGIMNVRYK